MYKSPSFISLLSVEIPSTFPDKDSSKVMSKICLNLSGFGKSMRIKQNLE